MSLRFRFIVSLPLLLACCLNSVADESATEGEKDKKATPRIKISKETTFIEEPVGKDGHINYIEALNHPCRISVYEMTRAWSMFYSCSGRLRSRAQWGLAGVVVDTHCGETWNARSG